MMAQPMKCDILEIVVRRSEFVDREVFNEFARLKKGMEGEKVVLDYIKKYGRKHWKVLPNLWLDYYGAFESDLLLLTRNGSYALEIKNYNGFFKYENGISKLNNREIGGNAIYQTRKATKNLRELIQQKVYNANVQGALIFIGEDNPIEISPPIDDIHILQRNQLRGFIQRVCEEEDRSGYPNQDIDKVVTHLKAFETENPYKATPISPKEMATLKKGILCAKCAGSEISISKKFVTCPCGHVELRDEAMVRTICEYGVLNFDKNLKLMHLIDFFRGQASKGYLKLVLKKYFELVKLGRYSYYINLKLPYAAISSQFDYK